MYLTGRHEEILRAYLQSHEPNANGAGIFLVLGI